MISVTRIARKYPLPSFFILAYLITWALEAPAIIVPEWPGLLAFFAMLGPCVAALIVVGLVSGRDGILELLAPIKKWRVNVKWYLVVLFGPALTMISSVYLYRLVGNGSGIPDSLQILPMLGSHLLALIAIFVYQVLIIWGEEIGWRGYALPILQARYHPILASVIIGVLWGLWHLPSFWIEGSVHQSMTVQFFVLASVGYSILYTWIYNGTGGSLLLMCILHAANNTTVSYTMLFFKPILEESVFSLAVLGLFDLLVMLIAGPKLLWRPSENEVSVSDPSVVKYTPSG
jgi:membrane protease YdiL (CAAX protease family)